MSTQQYGTPTLAKIGLGAIIKRLMEDAGISDAEIAAAVGVHVDTIDRWKKGQFAPKRSAITVIVTVTGASPEEMSVMNTLSLESKKKGLFEGNNVPPELRVLYETEATARLIRSIELEYIPGLLQTRRYHLAAQAAQVAVEEEKAATLRRLRIRRQEIVFGRVPLPRMQFIIGIAALAYLEQLPGDLRDEQIDRLREVAALPGVSIRVITGLHAGMLGSFTILTPAASTRAEAFAYVEDNDGGRYVEGDVVSGYDAVHRRVWDRQSIELEEYLR